MRYLYIQNLINCQDRLGTNVEKSGTGRVFCRNDATGEYLAAMWVGQKLTMYTAFAKPGGDTLDFSVAIVHPFKDKDDLNLMYDVERKQWIDMQIHYQTQELQYCDNSGYGMTRWVSARNSTDGKSWSPNHALRGPEAGVRAENLLLAPFCTTDRKFSKTGSGQTQKKLRKNTMRFSQDPPELEFYRIRPFYLGASGRFAAHALNYAPSPIELNALSRYGRQPPQQKFCQGLTHGKPDSPSGPCPGTPANPAGPGGFANPVCMHGPHMW